MSEIFMPDYRERLEAARACALPSTRSATGVSDRWVTMIGALGPWVVVGAVVIPLAAVAIVAGMVALTRRGTAPRQPFRR